jgi:hypothetical protein
VTPFTGSGAGGSLTRNYDSSPNEEKLPFFHKKSNSPFLSFLSFLSFRSENPRTTFYAKTRCEVRSLSLSLSLVCLFIYAKRFITCEEYYFVSARLIKRFCVAVFASGGFFSLSSSLLRALFVVLSLLERNGREKSYALFVSSLRNGKRENVLRERNEDRVVLILASRVTMARVVFYHQAHIAV